MKARCGQHVRLAHYRPLPYSNKEAVETALAAAIAIAVAATSGLGKCNIWTRKMQHLD